MYCEHYGLREKPFSLIPDPSYLHFSPGHHLAYTMLEYGMHEQTGITVITGEIGCGKTTLLKYLLNQTNENELTIGLLDSYLDPSLRFLYWFAYTFDIATDSKDYVSLLRDVKRYLDGQRNAGKRVILIVDEAQNLSIEALEELRLLTNINSDKNFVLQVILVGQPQLLDLLSEQKLVQFAQRITSEYHLESLSWLDTKAYINHRMKVAGASYRVFDEFAMGVIYYHSRGVPRVINTLCDYALVHGYASGTRFIDFRTAVQATRGRKIGGVSGAIALRPDAERLRQDVKAKAGLDIAAV